MSESRVGIWSNTATGRQAFISDPRPEDVDIEDIALSLAKLCRFGGHVKRNVWHYSVAQHCVLVSYECAPENALLGLLHDAAEAYVGDVVRPLKLALRESQLAYFEHRWAVCIGLRFGLGGRLADLPRDVKRADEVLLATERRDVVDHADRPWMLDEQPREEVIRPWPAEIAYNNFMGRFGELVRGDDARRYVP